MSADIYGRIRFFRKEKFNFLISRYYRRNEKEIFKSENIKKYFVSYFRIAIGNRHIFYVNFVISILEY